MIRLVIVNLIEQNTDFSNLGMEVNYPFATSYIKNSIDCKDTPKKINGLLTLRINPC